MLMNEVEEELVVGYNRPTDFLGEHKIDNVKDHLNANQQLVIAGGTNDPSSAILVESNRGFGNVRSLCCSLEEVDT